MRPTHPVEAMIPMAVQINSKVRAPRMASPLNPWWA